MTKTLLLTILLTATFFSARAQTFNNLNFSQSSDTSQTGFAYWDLSWGARDNVSVAMCRTETCMALYGKNERSVTFVEQTAITPAISEHRIITVSATVHSDSIVGKGAGLNIGLYDKAGNLIASKDMGGFYSMDWITGSNEKTCSVSLVCPPETHKIKVGMILFGKGAAFFSNYNVKIITAKGRKPSKLATNYITAACDTIIKHSLVRDSIDIKKLKEIALQIAGPAKQYSDCYLAVSFLLESLRAYGDHHSFLMTAKEVTNWKDEGSQVSKIQFAEFENKNGYGYIKVPPFHGGNHEQILAFADSLQSAIQLLSAQGIKGWIIDLRENTGGNMGPMVAGLGPLFSDEKLGSLVDVNGQLNSWYYKNGNYSWDDDPAGWNVTHPVKLTTALPIAVLISNQTGSSGEAVTLSFVGNKKTKLFGQPTWGLTTGNGSFDLADGSQIYLASTIMADRNKKQYDGSITPDVIVGENEDVMVRVVEWLGAGN